MQFESDIASQKQEDTRPGLQLPSYPALCYLSVVNYQLLPGDPDCSLYGVYRDVQETTNNGQRINNHVR
jgi:hypothetical protein